MRDANSDNAKNKNPKHADHRDQILQKSKVKSKNKENKPNKFSDTGTAKTKKVYANKTKANAATKIKKVFGSPNKRKQMLEYLAERDIIPELNNQIRNEKVGEFFTSLKEDSPKNPVTYQMLGKLQGKISVPNALSARKLFHLSHKKSKEFLSDKPISRKVRKNKIPEKVKSKVKDFFNRCDIVFINPSKPYKYMRLCFRDAYRQFMKENPNFTISFNKFYELRPKDILKPVSSTPLQTCLCIYCTNVKLKLEKLGIPELTSQYQLFDHLICKKLTTHEFRNENCIFQKCNTCKNWQESLFKHAYEKNVDLSKTIVWKKWVTEIYDTKSGKQSKRKTLNVKEGSKYDCMKELLETDIQNPNQGFTFIQHFFSQKYQNQIFNQCKKNLEDFEVMIVQDFSNNVDLTHQDQVKGAHWSTNQVTVHPSVAFVKIPNVDKLKKFVITHLSDINQHDACMVHYITLDCIQYLSEKLTVSLNKIYLWSDGCASQYKGKTSFYFLSKYKLNIERNYFHTEHGKNESDAATSEIVRNVRKGIRGRCAIIQNADDMKFWLAKEFSEKPQYIFREIKASDLQPIKKELEDVKLSVLDGKCTRSLHQIKPDAKPGYFLTRPFSCFCHSCKQNDYNNCQNKTFTKGLFSSHKLPSNNDMVITDDNVEVDDEVIYFDAEYDSENIIEITQENLTLGDIINAAPRNQDEIETLGSFVIAEVKDETETKSERFVAMLHRVDEDETIWLEYLKPHLDSNTKFAFYNTRETHTVEKSEIIMMLPKPKKLRRGGFEFNGCIYLQQL